MIKDIPLATSKVFGSSAIPNWGRTDHGNAAKHRNQTEVEGMHDSVAVVCRIVKKRNGEDGGTYERLRMTVDLKSVNFGGAKTGYGGWANVVDPTVLI